MQMKLLNTVKDNSTTYTIQCGENKPNHYLIYTEWTNDKGKVIDWTLVDQNGNNITDETLIESVFEYVDNLAE